MHPGKTPQIFVPGGKRQRFEIEQNKLTQLLLKSGDAQDVNDVDMLIGTAVDKGMLCKLPKSTFYVLNDQSALEVSEDMGDFFNSRFTRAPAEERRRTLIEYFCDIAACSPEVREAWETIWTNSESDGEKTLVEVIDKAPLPSLRSHTRANNGDDNAEEKLSRLQANLYEYLSRDALFTRLGLDAAVLGVVSVRLRWSHEQTLVAARESSAVVFTAMIGECSCPGSDMYVIMMWLRWEECSIIHRAY